MDELNIIQEEKDNKNIAYAIEPNFPMPNEMRVGIDPGTRNLGIAVIKPEIETVNLYKIVLERHKNALLRLLEAQQVLGDTIGHFTLNAKAIIEGAGYMASVYRQVELSEQRAGFLLWFHKFGIDVDMIPPNSIRKVVFGSAKIKNPWGIDDNCAAALACALYAKD